MKLILTVLLLAASASAQEAHGVTLTACGPESAIFRVNHDSTQQAFMQPVPGKALVYFIEDIGGEPVFGPAFVIRIGLDGAWVGANRNNSYFAVSAAPGVHHICARPQSRFWMGQVIQLAHFAAEAGKVYYFRTRFTAQGYLFLDPIDSDEGEYWIAAFPLSVSTPKR